MSIAYFLAMLQAPPKASVSREEYRAAEIL